MLAIVKAFAFDQQIGHVLEVERDGLINIGNTATYRGVSTVLIKTRTNSQRGPRHYANGLISLRPLD